MILRKELLSKLINMDGSTESLIHELLQFNWDSDEEWVTLKRQHILKVLQRYLAGELQATEIENWANAIEGREDIGKEIYAKELIDELIHELANPDLTERLSKERARILCSKIIAR